MRRAGKVSSVFFLMQNLGMHFIKICVHVGPKIAQQVRVLAAKAEDRNSILGIYMIEGENQFPH